MSPTKVTRTAFQNAASIAGLPAQFTSRGGRTLSELLTTEALVTEIPEKEETPLSRRSNAMADPMPPGGMDY